MKVRQRAWRRANATGIERYSFSDAVDVRSNSRANYRSRQGFRRDQSGRRRGNDVHSRLSNLRTRRRRYSTQLLSDFLFHLTYLSYAGFLPLFGPCFVNLYGAPRAFDITDEYDYLNEGEVPYKGFSLIHFHAVTIFVSDGRRCLSRSRSSRSGHNARNLSKGGRVGHERR